MVIMVAEKRQLYGHSKFKSFAEEFSHKIVYADKDKNKVINALLTPIDFDTDMNAFNLYGGIEVYEFDGWCVAVK